jgi:hypothetical protein
VRSASKCNGVGFQPPKPVRVPSATLVELYRGGGIDEAIDLELGRGYARVVTTGGRIARLAGHLLAAIGAASEMAIDALVVGIAIRLGGGLVLTHQAQDLEGLATNQPNFRVVAVQVRFRRPDAQPRIRQCRRGTLPLRTRDRRSTSQAGQPPPGEATL